MTTDAVAVPDHSRFTMVSDAVLKLLVCALAHSSFRLTYCSLLVCDPDFVLITPALTSSHNLDEEERPRSKAPRLSFLFFAALLALEPSTSHMLGKSSTPTPSAVFILRQGLAKFPRLVLQLVLLLSQCPDPLGSQDVFHSTDMSS